MKWINFFDIIVVLNLRKRVDRLLHITEQMELMNIPFELVTSIENENGAIGLRDTVVKVFEESIELGHKNILIFEDDCEFIESKQVLDDTMNNAVEQLPDYYHILYLGAQVTNGFKRRHSSSLLQLDMAFATHCFAISLDGMKTIMSMELDYPIDNSIVNKLQPLQKCFITYPLLANQKAGISDINTGGDGFVDWKPFIVDRYRQQLANFNQ